MHVFIDFEASSLAKQSYPIEVAWVFEDGEAESHLIRPLPGWTDWDDSAAAIHGITRQQLDAEGTSADAVARHVLERLSGHDLYASSPSWDGKWLSVLLRAGGLPRHALRLKDTDEAQLAAARAGLASAVDPSNLDREAAALIERVRSRSINPMIHRALPDAQYELMLWLEVRRTAEEQARSKGG